MLRMIHAGLVLAAITMAQTQGPGITGAWRFNPELSTPVPSPGGGDRPRGRGPGGGPPGGGRPGSGGMGVPGMGRGPSEEDMRRARVIVQRLTEPPALLVIVHDGPKVIVTDGDGRSVTYIGDGRKEERVTGDGEFPSRARFEGEALVVEEDFGGGVKLTTRVAPIVSEERQRLEITLKATGLPKPPRPPGGRDPEQAECAPRAPLDSATRVYERAGAVGLGRL